MEEWFEYIFFQNQGKNYEIFKENFIRIKIIFTIELNTLILIYVSFFRTWFTNPLIYIYNLYKFYDNIKVSSRE